MWEICSYERGAFRLKWYMGYQGRWMNEEGRDWLEFANVHNMIIIDLRPRMEENE